MKLVIDGAIFGLQKAGGISRLWAEILLGLDQEFAKTHQVILLVPRNQNVEWHAISQKLKSIKVKKRRRFK